MMFDYEFNTQYDDIDDNDDDDDNNRSKHFMESIC